MNTYQIQLEVDEGWLEAIQKFTDVDVYDGEVLQWTSLRRMS